MCKNYLYRHKEELETRLKAYSIDKNLHLLESDENEINKIESLILLRKYIQKIDLW